MSKTYIYLYNIFKPAAFCGFFFNLLDIAMLPAMTGANPYYDKTKYALVISLINNTFRNSFFFHVKTSIKIITGIIFFFSTCFNSLAVK